MATKEQRELADIYCALTDLHEAFGLLRDGLVDPKHLKSKDFKAVRDLPKFYWNLSEGGKNIYVFVPPLKYEENH